MTFLHTTRLVAGLLFRRMCNRSLAGLRRKRKGGERTGTGRKAVGSPLLALFLMVWLGFIAVSLSFGLLVGISETLGPYRNADGHLEITQQMYQALVDLEQRQKDPALRVQESAMVFRLNRDVPLPDQVSNSRVKGLQEVYREKGRDGFAQVKKCTMMVRAWEHPETKPILLRAMGMLLLLIAACRYFIGLGSSNKDLGKVEWTTEWLFTFPAPAHHLFAAQILGHALVDPISWMGIFPFLTVLFRSSGMAWGVSLPAALCGALYLSLVMAALRVTTETWLRKRLAPGRLKNLQALFTLLGIVTMFALFLLTRGGSFCAGWVEVARKGSWAWVLNPFSLPAEYCRLPGCAMAALQGAVAIAGVFVAVRGCAWLVRGGLIATSSVYEGKRGKGRLGFLSGGIIGKDIRLLLRDRNFLVQTLVAPVLVVGFQVFMNGSAPSFFFSNFQHAATFAYGLGAYVLVASALSVLSVEGTSLWMLYTLPAPLDRLMLRKTCLWAACALFYTGVTLALCAACNPALNRGDLVYAAMACAGVVIYAFIASGLGMLGTDPLEPEVKRRIRMDMAYLYTLLASMFAYAIYAPSAWTRLGQLVLSSLLAYALWQKVRDRVPYLLDPVSAPPQQVSLADGLIAALSFFVLQGVTMLLALFHKIPTPAALTLAYAIAGLLVVFFTLFSFKSNLRALWAFGAEDREGFARSLGFGGIAGLGAATFGVAYLAALPFFPALERLREAAPASSFGGGWLVLLAVGVAPLAEEFIFRGLVFGGMRRSLPLTVSVLGSAAIFAICHPPVAVIPVFGLGVFAALGYERTGRLTAPIVTHMVYNAVVILIHGPF